MNSRQSKITQFTSGNPAKKRKKEDPDAEYKPSSFVSDALSSRQLDLQGNVLLNADLKRRFKRKVDPLTQEEIDKQTLKDWNAKKRGASILSVAKRPKKQQHATSQVKTQLEKVKSAPVAIIARDDGKIRGYGSYFDHFAVQTCTQQATQSITLPSSKDHLSEFVNNHASSALKGTEQTALGKVTPKSFNLKDSASSSENSESKNKDNVIDPDKIEGLLYVPGLPRSIKDDENYRTSSRHRGTINLIKKAQLLGMPVIGVCGGAWEVFSGYPFEYTVGKVTYSVTGSLKLVRDHSWNQGMPSVNSSNGLINRNVQVHAIKLADTHSILRGALRYSESDQQTKLLRVNSVHWQAPDPDVMSDQLTITAISKINPDFKAKNRQGEPFLPEENTVEAFETISGAPVVGVMWHPEAYATDKDDNAMVHRRLLNYMQAAGTAYTQRRAMVKDLQEKFATVDYKPPLKHFSLFKFTRDNEGNAISTIMEDERKKVQFALHRKGG